MDTIYALSSGAVPSGVAVIRISGPATRDALTSICGGLPDARRAELRVLRRPSDGSVLDEGLVLWFPAPRSYTGEDLAELQLHGGRAVITAVFQALSEHARLASPGEFSRRAFHNGKLDLTEIEGLADLIAAETEMQRRQAVGQARGALARRAEAWREALIALRAELEARLDFADEGDVPDALPEGFWAALDGLRADLADSLATGKSGERIREGYRIAIVGRPNAGKSSLLNALARREVAIVTEEAGTTRDVLELPLNLNGYAVLLFDTAGLREACSEAEREGVRRARLTAEAADLVLWLEDSTEPPGEAWPVPGIPVWRVRTKMDLSREPATSEVLAISAKSGEGLDVLAERIGETVAAATGSESAIVARQRQREAIEAAILALGEACGAADEVVADLLRSAGEAIGRLTGRIGIEDVLDRLFAEFCIGK